MARILAVAAALLLAACGGGSAPLSTEEQVEALLDLCEAIAEERCEQVGRCGAHPAECVHEGCDTPAWQRSVQRIEQGVARYDRAAAAECLVGMRDTCSSWHPACAAVLKGNVKAGGACSAAPDCAGPAVCVLEASCPGTCVPRPAVGEACEWGSSVSCQGDAYCDGGRCTALVGEGGACNGEYRLGVGLGSGPVEPPPEPEPGQLLCDRGLDCIEGRCARQQSQPRPSAGRGEECGGPLESDKPLCAGDLFCDVRSDICAEPGGEGESCPATGAMHPVGEAPCKTGLICFESICTAVAAPGDRCDEGVMQCPGGLPCLDGTCSLLPRLGEACDPDAVAAPFVCAPEPYDPLASSGAGFSVICDPETRICVRSGGHGEACSEHGDCSGWCIEGRCVGDVCAP